MAIELRFPAVNTGTESAPVWKQWFNYTVAQAVLMSDAADETKTIVDYVNEKIAAVIGSSTPETLDTLEEIANWIGSHQDIVDTLNNAIAGKADKDHRHNNATASADGFMSKEYAAKLDGIEAGANKYVHPASHPASMIVEDDTHKFATKEQLEALDTNTTYTNATPIVQAHGGVAVGDTFDAVPVQEMFDKILYPYVAPVVSVTGTPNGGTFEIGVGTTLSKATVSVTKKARAITKIEVFGSDDAATPLATVTDGVANGGSFPVTLTKELKTAALNGFKLNVKVTDSDGKVTPASSTAFNLVHPFYHGSTSSAITAAVVKALTKKVETKGNKKWAYTADNQKMVFAYPASYGNLTKIFDANNFDVTDTFTKSTVDIVAADGSTVPYNVYVNAASTVSGFNMDFRF